MAQLAKVLLTNATTTGPGTAIDLTSQARNLTMFVNVGGVTPDPLCQVALQGSLDNANWFGLGEVIGNGFVSNTGHVVQYIRANVIKIASGNVSANASFA